MKQEIKDRIEEIKEPLSKLLNALEGEDDTEQLDILMDIEGASFCLECLIEDFDKQEKEIGEMIKLEE